MSSQIQLIPLSMSLTKTQLLEEAEKMRNYIMNNKNDEHELYDDEDDDSESCFNIEPRSIG